MSNIDYGVRCFVKAAGSKGNNIKRRKQFRMCVRAHAGARVCVCVQTIGRRERRVSCGLGNSLIIKKKKNVQTFSESNVDR